MSATLEDLTVEKDVLGVDGLALVTLDRPDRRNSMSQAMTRSWGHTMAELAGDEQLRCVVVTGAGGAFCAGGDLDWLGVSPEATVDSLRTKMQSFYRTWLSVRALEVPTIAAINGAAVGAGLAIALACDIRYAARDARLSVPFTGLGLHPGMATSWLIRETAGLAVAKEMLLTGRVLTGEEAATCGLVSRAVDPGEVVDVALASARRVCEAAPVATRLTKAALSDGGPDSFEGAVAWDSLAQPITMTTADLQEGLAAARDRRPPRFEGR